MVSVDLRCPGKFAEAKHVAQGQRLDLQGQGLKICPRTPQGQQHCRFAAIILNWVVGCWHGYQYRARCSLAAQLMPLPLTVSCFSEVQIGFTFLVLAHPDSPGKRAVKRLCVYRSTCVCQLLQLWTGGFYCPHALADSQYPNTKSNILESLLNWTLVRPVC